MASTTPTAAVSRSLAIAAHIPSREIGSGYFQETHPEHLFRDCSHYCELVSQPEQMPRVLEIAIQTARARRGVAVVVLPGDIALREAVGQQPRLRLREPRPSIRPSDEELATMAGLLNEARRVTILGGAGMRGCPHRGNRGGGQVEGADRAR